MLNMQDQTKAMNIQNSSGEISEDGTELATPNWY